jgi:hypothetical protein
MRIDIKVQGQGKAKVQKGWERLLPPVHFEEIISG